MNYFINYDSQRGVTINTFRNQGWSGEDVADLVENMAQGVRGNCPLEGAKDALEDGAAWAGTNATIEILEQIHEAIERFENETT